MTLEELKNRLLGKQIEFHSFGAGAYNQCVDLVNYYINTVLDTSTKDYTEIIGANAKDFNTKYDPEDFEWIANTPEAVVQRGDIVVWNGRVGGGVGHVAIALSGDVNSFQSLDQNWSQVERVTLETHDYKNVSGWLRPKNVVQTVSISQKELDELRNARDTHYNELQAEKEITKEQKKVIEKQTNDLLDTENKLGQCLNITGELNEQDKNTSEQLIESQKKVTELEKRIKELEKIKQPEPKVVYKNLPESRWERLLLVFK